jgi:hypothetical protein
MPSELTPKSTLEVWNSLPLYFTVMLIYDFNYPIAKSFIFSLTYSVFKNFKMHIKSKIPIFTIHIVKPIFCVKIEMKRFYKIGVKRLEDESAGSHLPFSTSQSSLKSFKSSILTALTSSIS